MSIIDSLAAASRIMGQLVIDPAISLCEGTDFDMVVLPARTLRRIPSDGEYPVKFRESPTAIEGDVLLINSSITEPFK